MSVHKIICGKSETELKQFDDDSFDSCITDPPYGLEFMGKDWDRLSGGFSNGEFKGFRLPQTSGGNRNVKCPDCGKWIYDHYPRNCTCGGVERYKSRKMQEWHYQWATELYRVMKPGAHILVFGGDRTEHRMKCAIEDAGFEIRGTIVWVYGSGFPKSLDISKSLDKMAGKERAVIGTSYIRNGKDGTNNETFKQAKRETTFITAPATEEAIQWNGWGTGLKPAVELICMARKPISERNIASNALKWGVGGINVDGCRIGNEIRKSNINDFSNIHSNKYGSGAEIKTIGYDEIQGRFPANLIVECCCEADELVEGKAISSGGGMHATGKISDSWITEPRKNVGYGEEKCLIHTNPNCVCRMLDEQSGNLNGEIGRANRKQAGDFNGVTPFAKLGMITKESTKDKGGASRFYYQAKASQKERWFYCTICKQAYPMKERDKHIHGAPEKTKYKYLEFHPTQKPEDLISYLMRLITPPNGKTIDPFLGSGTGIISAEREGFNCVGIDSKQEYCEIGYARGKSELVQQKISGEQSTIERIGF